MAVWYAIVVFEMVIGSMLEDAQEEGD